MSFPLVLRFAACAAATVLSPAHGADPRIEPGKDPGGTAVAVIDDGFDYTQVGLAAILARDGEGEAIAWDAIDDDARPYRAAAGGDAIARAAAARGSVRIVMARADPATPASLARAITFAASSPARIVIVALDADHRAALPVLASAADRFAHLLFLTSLPAPTDDDRKAAARSNLVLLDTSSDRAAAANAVAQALGCRPDIEGETGAERAAQFSSRLAEPPAADCQREPGRTK